MPTGIYKAQNVIIFKNWEVCQQPWEYCHFNDSSSTKPREMFELPIREALQVEVLWKNAVDLRDESNSEILRSTGYQFKGAIVLCPCHHIWKEGKVHGL